MNNKINLKHRLFLLLFSFSFINPSLSFGNNECIGYLPKKNLTKSIESVFQILNLPHPNNSKDKNSGQMTSLAGSVQFFRDNLIQLHGGQKLIEILENGEDLTSQILKNKIKIWAKEFLPGYEILFTEEVSKFNFENSYRNPNFPFLHSRTGTLDDKFLFELYSKKKIPILNQLDLVSQILVLAQPKLRLKFEKLVRAYQRAQDLGDLTDEDQFQKQVSKNPKYANMNRLTYISTITQMLTGQIVFLSPIDNQRKLVIWGFDNLANPLDYVKNKTSSLKRFIDLSLINAPKALNYFIQQSESKSESVFGLFVFLTKNGVLPKPAISHMESPRFSFEALSASLSHIDLIRIQSEFESRRTNKDLEQAWIQFSNMLYFDDSNPISKILRYRFRFDWISHYINIVEEDLTKTEAEAHKFDPGPLFR